MSDSREEQWGPPSQQGTCISRLVDASRTFETEAGVVKAVDGATLSVSRGEMVGIMGPSGSGKTTLLNLIGMLEDPSSGDVYFEEKLVRDYTAAERRRLRLTRVGFVFQQFRLIPTLSVIENVELPMALLSRSGSHQKMRARELIESVGLAGKGERRPGKLSVGEQQRVAVARALANNPALILADEPTSQLDSTSGGKIIDLLDDLRKRTNAAVVVTTHDSSISSLLARVYRMRDGVLAVVK
jgi:putative ABC transport system ATP-binding protein